MARRRNGRVEEVTFNGIVFRRYPDSLVHAARSYYVPGSNDRTRGVGRLHEEIWKAAHGPIPRDRHIHHIDGNPLNNAIENLACLDQRAHRRAHVELQRANGGPSERQLRHLEDIRCLASDWHRSPEGRRWHVEHGRAVYRSRVPLARVCDQCGASFGSMGRRESDRFCSNNCKSAWRRASGVDDIARRCVGCGRFFTVNKYSVQRHCSRSCARLHQSPRSAAGLQPQRRG